VPAAIPATLSAWLAHLHLELYAACFSATGFRDEDIVLVAELTEAQVGQLGVVRPGHQRKILLAVQTLKELVRSGCLPQGALALRFSLSLSSLSLSLSLSLSVSLSLSPFLSPAALRMPFMLTR
jgi:hypothetical protein